MKCPNCKAITLVLDTDTLRQGHKRRNRFCNICQTKFKTFQPLGRQEVITNYIELCECGEVVTKELPIPVIKLDGFKIETIKVCDTCFELEQKLGKCSYLV